MIFFNLNNNTRCIIFAFSLYCEGLLCIKYCLHILETASLALIKSIFTWGKRDAGFRGVHILCLGLNKWSVNIDCVKQEFSQGCLFPQPRLCSGLCVCVCVCVWKYYSATKKKEVLPFARTWVDLEGSMLSEMSDREKQRLYYLIYIWNLKTKSKQTHRKRDQDCGCQRQRWRVRKWMRWSKGENPYGFRLFFSPQSIFFINSLRVNFGEARFLNSTRPENAF